MITTLQQSGRARYLALLALLFVLGLQSVEVGHSHVDHDGTVECLACKSSSVGVTAVATATVTDAIVVAVPPVAGTSAVPVSAFSLYDSRGPPQLS